jgi:cell division protein FtsZ
MINLRIQTPETRAAHPTLKPRLAVIGVGGAGSNAVDNMIAAGMEDVEFIICNTDAQALAAALSEKRVQLGATVTGGLGAGTKPEVGRAAAEESIDDVMRFIDGANMVFITAGMGGGTGTGAAPVIARACKEAGILTVGVVTKPFHFEGPACMKQAEGGITELQKYVDALIVIPNQNLFRVVTEKIGFDDALKHADTVLHSSVRGVTDLIVTRGKVNVDFADIRTTMTEMGKAMMGTGQAAGERRASLAAEAAINNPLLDDLSIKGARKVIVNIAGGSDMTLFEVDEICNKIREEVDVDANIILGTTHDQGLDGSLRVTVLATGIENEADRRAKADDTKGNRFATARTAPANIPVPRAYAAPVDQYVEPVAQQSYVQGQAFIPPQAIEVDAPQNAPVKTVSYDHIVAGVAAPQYVPEEQQQPVAAAPEYVPAPMPQPAPAPEYAAPQQMPPMSAYATPVRRPQPMAPEQQPALSLFQRITNRMRRSVEASFGEDNGAEDVYAAPAHHRGGAQPAVSSQPIPAAAQVPVEVARPAKNAAQPELDLDIPAFLRRQAS